MDKGGEERQNRFFIGSLGDKKKRTFEREGVTRRSLVIRQFLLRLPGALSFSLEREAELVCKKNGPPRERGYLRRPLVNW